MIKQTRPGEAECNTEQSGGFNVKGEAKNKAVFQNSPVRIHSASPAINPHESIIYSVDEPSNSIFDESGLLLLLSINNFDKVAENNCDFDFRI